MVEEPASDFNGFVAAVDLPPLVVDLGSDAESEGRPRRPALRPERESMVWSDLGVRCEFDTPEQVEAAPGRAGEWLIDLEQARGVVPATCKEVQISGWGERR